MACEIIWSRRARRNLEEIVRRIADDSPLAAAVVLNDIHIAIARLEHTPYLGAVCEHRRLRNYREILCHRWRIFYRFFKQERQVQIALIWHGSRQEPDFL